MALAIASIPVLTGDAAKNFEAQAQKSYEDFQNRSEAENEKVTERCEKGMAMVRQVLAKSHIGEK
jgi:hypothetical protein